MKPLGLLISFAFIASTSRIVNFDSATLGKMPAGWTAEMTNHGAAPKWEVLRDGSAPTQPYVLAQVSNDPTGNRFPMAIFDELSTRDSDISVRMKPLGGHAEQTGGLVFRFLDKDNYYLARANALDHSVALFKVQHGQRMPLCAGVHHDIPLNDWSILKVSVRGNRFQVYINHRRVLQTSDDTFSQSGRVGLWTMGDSVTYFDDFRVYPK
jgi:hypothetical protein